MKVKNKKLNRRFSYAIIAALVMANMNFPGNISVYAKTLNTKLVDKDRLYGANRYDTAAKVSEYGWETSDYVILANGENFADALCAAPLAKKYNAPILLTPSNELNDSTLKEIQRLKATNIFIIGKYGAVSQVSEDSLKTLNSNIQITRLGGNDRYETSLEVAKALGNVSKVAVASGEGYADALSIASVAAALTDKDNSMAILLTAKDKLPDSIQKYLADNKAKITDTFIIGGFGAVSKEAAEKVSDNFVRLSGEDRYETNTKVMTYFLDKLKFDKFYIVEGNGPKGDEFADALSGAALASITSSPIVLTYKTLSKTTKEFIEAAAAKGARIIAVGGEAVVPKELLQSVKDILIAIGGETPTPPTTPTTPAVPGGTQTTPSTPSAADVKAELTSIYNKFSSIDWSSKPIAIQSLASNIKISLGKAIADASYDVTNDAVSIKAQYRGMETEDKTDFRNTILNSIDLSTILKIANIYGVD